jgi:anti-anti-sigma regulatory factor
MSKENVIVDRGVTVVQLDKFYSHEDRAGTNRAESLLGTLAETVQPPLLVVDLSNTVEVPSSLVGKLTAAYKRLKARGGQFAVCAADAFCTDTLRIMRLDEVLGNYRTRDEAVAAVLQASQGGQSTAPPAP